MQIEIRRRSDPSATMEAIVTENGKTTIWRKGNIDYAVESDCTCRNCILCKVTDSVEKFLNKEAEK